MGVRISWERSERKLDRICFWIERVFWRLFMVEISGVNSSLRAYLVLEYSHLLMIFLILSVILPIGWKMRLVHMIYRLTMIQSQRRFSIDIFLSIDITKVLSGVPGLVPIGSLRASIKYVVGVFMVGSPRTLVPEAIDITQARRIPVLA